MSAASEILSLLKEKKALLLEIERITCEMKDAPAADLMELFTRRGELLEQAQALGGKANALADSEELKAALSSSISPDGLKGEVKEIYDASLAVKAAANRAAREDSFVLEHVKAEREDLLKKIEGLNSSGSAVASSYRRSVQTGVPQSQLMRKPKSI